MIRMINEEAYELAESIIRTVREPLLILNGDLIVLRANRSFYKTFHVTPQETEGRKIFNLGNQQWNIPALKNLLENILPNKTIFENFEVEHVFENIGRKNMLLNARELIQNKSTKRLVLLAIEDITERKLLLAEKEKLEKELVHYEKLSIIGTMAAKTAHELNEPLTSILGYAELLKNNYIKSQKDFDNIIQASLHAREVIKNILLFSKKKLEEKTEVDLSLLLDEVLIMVQFRLSEKSIKLKKYISSDLPGILVHAGRLRQLFINLINNSIEATHEGGMITIKINRAGKGIKIVFSDTGKGIDQEVKNKIFEPFFTTKPDSHGSGLGLS